MDPQAEETLRYRAKAMLRQRARALRGSIPLAALAERSQRIVEKLQSVLSGARKVALFWPMEDKHEVDLRPLDVVLRSQGVQLAYPAIDESRVMTFRWVDDVRLLEERGLGFQEPSSGALEADHLDVIVVPALQLDPRGYRIGYGAGYYDRTLPRYAPPARKIGVAFDFQLIAEVPTTPGDVAVDTVITDARTIAAKS